MDNTVTLIENIIKESFSPEVFKVINESALHVGHKGKPEGMGHYALVISRNTFANQSPLAAHRAIYHALGDLMKTHIHALRIEFVG